MLRKLIERTSGLKFSKEGRGSRNKLLLQLLFTKFFKTFLLVPFQLM